MVYFNFGNKTYSSVGSNCVGSNNDEYNLEQEGSIESNRVIAWQVMVKIMGLPVIAGVD